MNARIRTIVAASLASASLLAAPTAFGQADCLRWINRPPAGAFGPALTNVASCYDSRRAVTVAFGPNIGTTAFETWEFDGVQWTKRVVGASPDLYPPSIHFDTVFDSIRGVSVFVIGPDVWEWDGTVWTHRADSPFPGQAYFDADLAFDSARGVVVLFGGAKNGGGFTNETWEYSGQSNGTAWTQKLPATSPTPRSQMCLCYDPVRQVVVMFGGQHGAGLIDGDTWDYDGATWTQRAVGAITLPSPRRNPALEFDSRRNIVVMEGGTTSSSIANDTWEFDGSAWRQRMPVNLSSPLTARSLHTLVQNPFTHQMYMLGGNTISQNTNFLAELLEANPITIVTNPQSASVHVGSPAEFSVEAEGETALTYQWRHNGVPIASATFANFLIAAAGSTDQGVYDCIVGYAGFAPFGAPTTTSAPAGLTVTSACPSDINGDGQTNSTDLSLILGNWGACAN